jgi:hypothetical protein
MVGKARMEMKVGLAFACINLKKLAKMKRKMGLIGKGFSMLFLKITELLNLLKKWH